MDNVIVADKYGIEDRTAIFSSYDMEIGDEDNSFEITIKRQEYEKVRSYDRIYIPGTEYGGFCRRWETDTKHGTITVGGITWRGMLKHKIIQPPSGQDYATDIGELNAIIKRRIEEAFPIDPYNTATINAIVGTTESTGVNITFNRAYKRYCTLLDGLEELLKSVGYRLNIEYDQIQRAAVVSAKKIVDYSRSVEFSSDMQVNYHVREVQDGINHLICLGAGELRDRTIVHLWMNDDGSVDDPNYQTATSGTISEVAEVYDYAGAEREDLINTGIQRLKEEAELSKYEISISGGLDIPIGDIVGGRDYLSGLYLKAPVAGKIIRWDRGFRTIEYRVSHQVELVEASEPGGDDPDVPPVLLASPAKKDEVSDISEPIKNTYFADEDPYAEPAEEVEE